MSDIGSDTLDAGEFAETIGMLLTGQLGDPGRYVQLHGWEVVALDIGEVTIRTRNNGAFLMTVQTI